MITPPKNYIFSCCFIMKKIKTTIHKYINDIISYIYFILYQQQKKWRLCIYDHCLLYCKKIGVSYFFYVIKIYCSLFFEYILCIYFILYTYIKILLNILFMLCKIYKKNKIKIAEKKKYDYVYFLM